MYHFPFYYQRILTSCHGWKDDQFGAYIKLLIYQFDKGSIPNDMEIISLIAPSAKKNWKLLSTKFEILPDGSLQNDIMNGIREDAISKQIVNSENGKKGGRKRTERLANANRTVKRNESESASETKAIPITNNHNKEIFKENWEGWFTNPFNFFLLTSEEIHLSKEFIFRLKHIILSVEKIKDLWIAFQTLTFDGDQFYESRSKCISHFKNWMKKQELEMPSLSNGVEEALIPGNLKRI